MLICLSGHWGEKKEQKETIPSNLWLTKKVLKKAFDDCDNCCRWKRWEKKDSFLENQNDASIALMCLPWLPVQAAVIVQ